MERAGPLTTDALLQPVSPFFADPEGVAGDPLPGASSGEASRGRGAGPGLPSGRSPVVSLKPRRPRGVGMSQEPEVPGKEGVVKEILNAVKAAIPELLKQPKCSSEGVRGRNA
jgi:hypothetical protein